MTNFDDVIKQLDTLETTRGKIAKTKVCKDMLIELPDIANVLEAAYGSSLYGLSKKSFNKAFEHDNIVKYSDPGLMAKALSTGTFDIDMFTIDRLLTNAKALTGKDLIHMLQQEVVPLKPEVAKWIVRILNKDLRLGMSVTSINKILKELGMTEIENFGVQLCGKFKSLDEIIKKLVLPFYACCKYDGMRGICKKVGNLVTFTSRQGEVIEYVPELVDFFRNSEGDFEIDGEIDCGNFSELSSRIGKKPENIKPLPSLHFRVYDILSFKGIDVRHMAYSYRRQLLFGNFEEHGLLKLEESERIESVEQLACFYNKMVERGEEGIVIKIKDAPYEVDSRNNMYKLKPVFENSFEITGGEYGSGKYANKISTIFVKDKNGIIKSGVGAGFKDDDRDLVSRLWAEGKLIGRIVDVSYYEISSNKAGDFSLRFPSFLKFRDDKIEADEVKK